MILGNYCTRSCGFCAIETMKNPPLPKEKELFLIRDLVGKLKLQKVVVTSVTRDDLPDKGSEHFAMFIELIKDIGSNICIEALVPDFLGDTGCLKHITDKKPNVIAHNLETVPRIYKKVRPGAAYQRSLKLIEQVKEINNSITTKSGIMVGLGETKKEVYGVMRDLAEAGCDIITIGQYLKPDSSCLNVDRFIPPEEFDLFGEWARKMGFKRFSCSPFTRSSYLD